MSQLLMTTSWKSTTGTWNRFHVPVVDDHQLEIVELGRHAAGRLLDFELVGIEHPDEVFLAGGRVARDQEDARAAQRNGVLEARLAEIAGGDPAGQRHRAHGVDAGLKPQTLHRGWLF